MEWIESCLAKQGMATLRRRKLPVENIVWLVVGMALFRDRSISEIVQRLDLVQPGEDGQQRDAVAGPRSRRLARLEYDRAI
ncbi:MAG: transposase domain-containing protein [Elusimicrobiota bacterium]|nr:transposase domain-containing protein [Elusimicrobiota bacterium]